MTDQLNRLRDRFGRSDIGKQARADFARIFSETEEERAAIYEECAGMTRQDAERRVVRERGGA